MLISVLKVVGNTAADGPGLRTSVYLAGCNHHCPGCHNPQSWDINNGTWMPVEDLVKEIESYGNKKVTLTGGDPLYQDEALVVLLRELKERDYNIWLYTGFTYGQIAINSGWKGCALNFVDGLVDGKFEQDLRDTNLRFRGSSNQKIYLRDTQGNFVEDTTQYC